MLLVRFRRKEPLLSSFGRKHQQGEDGRLLLNLVSLSCLMDVPTVG